jgi:hypothetical protein
MEKIEEFIRKNRDELDRYTPSRETWKGIRKGMHGRRLFAARWITAAAMIVVVFMTAALFYIAENRRDTAFAARNNEALIMKANPQIRETEIYYDNLVNDLYREASPLLTSHPDVEKELISDFSQLDSICAEIKGDLRENIANQEVIEALVNNYRIKIRILEDMLDVLKQNDNNQEKNNHHAL